MLNACDHCGKPFTNANPGRDLKHPMRECLAHVCDACYVRGSVDTRQALLQLRTEYENKLAWIKARLAEMESTHHTL